MGQFLRCGSESIENWGDLTGRESLFFKSKLIKLLEKIWSTYELNNNEAWPKISSFDKKLISSLISRIREDRYPDELE
ncbi:hypothetical protein Nmel_008254 [Mimus melanotis]